MLRDALSALLLLTACAPALAQGADDSEDAASLLRGLPDLELRREQLKNRGVTLGAIYIGETFQIRRAAWIAARSTPGG
jgi:carbohydrate-selective porin OprB